MEITSHSTGNDIFFILTVLRARLYYFSQIRDEAEAEFLRQLKEDGQIADSIRDAWKHQASGAE